jgi:hypothetical protein
MAEASDLPHYNLINKGREIFPFFMTEKDIKNLLGVYQQKTHELFSQNIALEAKIVTLSSLVEALTSKVNELTSLQQESPKTTRKTKNTPETDFV